MVVCIRVGHFYQIKLCDPSQVPQFRFSARILREILIIATLDSCRDCHNDQPPKENCHGSQLVDWIGLSLYTTADLMAGDQSHKHSDAIYNILSLDIFTAHHIFCSLIRWGQVQSDTFRGYHVRKLWIAIFACICVFHCISGFGGCDPMGFNIFSALRRSIFLMSCIFFLITMHGKQQYRDG